MGEEKKAAASRERILRCAADLFAENGYAGVSMREIASSSNLSKASIYYHFSGKQELYISLILRDAQSLVADLEGISRQDGPADELLWEFMGYYISFFKKHTPVMKLLFRQFSETRSQLQGFIPDMFLQLRRMLGRLLDRDECLARGDADLTALAILGAAHILASNCLETERYSEKDIIMHLRGLFGWPGGRKDVGNE